MKESRTQKTLLNAKYNVLFLSLNVFIAFFSRRIFLDSLGSSFVGLTSTLQSLLGFLNLAELGIGTAISVTLFAPLAKNDKKGVGEIVSVLGYLYRRIGLFILVAGGILSLFLPLIFAKEAISIYIVYFAFYAFLGSSLLTYFVNYKQTLLSADQKNYVVTKYLQTSNIVKLLLQMGLAHSTGSVYVWVAVEMLFGVLYCFILNRRIRKTYPWLQSDTASGKRLYAKYPVVGTYTKQLFIQKISGLVGTQATPFLVFAYVSLETVTCYTNYTTIITKISLFTNAFLTSTEAGVGNLIADKEKPYVMQVFREIFSLRFFLAAFYACMLYYLTEPFIALWLGEQYVLGKMLLGLLVADVFLTQSVAGIWQFLYGYGLFRDVWASVASSALLLSVALVGGYFWQLEGIVLGAVVSNVLVNGLWKPYFLYSAGFKESVWGYWRMWFRHVFAFCAAWAVCYPLHGLLDGSCKTWTSFALYAAAVGCLYAAAMAVAMFLVLPDFRALLKRFKFILK